MSESLYSAVGKLGAKEAEMFWTFTQAPVYGKSKSVQVRLPLSRG